MTVTRTPDVEVDQDFEVSVPITKSYVDEKTGKRHIVGVATGVAEDRDGERCSKSCVMGMGQQIEKGGVKVTSSHQQDWMTEIGDVEKYSYNAETDEMEVDGVLPPEGVDAIADKAWREANRPGSGLGWSVGGKLLKSYFERSEVGKKRKVLDAIHLRHIMLTKNPAYPNSFAEGVAKTFDGDAPADDEFTLEQDASVEKDMTTGSWASGDSDSGGGNTGRDSVGSGKRNAGTKGKDKGMSTEEDGSNDEDEGEDDKDLPKAPDDRHLACPNCGHEFAADLPVDPDERQGDDDKDNDDEDESDTGKSVETKPTMTKLSETLDELKALAATDAVAKTDDAAAADEAATGTEVAKVAADDAAEVAKMVAASHRANTDRLDGLETRTGEGFELVAKAIKGLSAKLDDLPRGRQSVARVLPPSTGHHDEEGNVEKTTQELVDEAPDAVTALKVMNTRTYGVK